jgi:transglutaminase-like putative cysteine protease
VTRPTKADRSLREFLEPNAVVQSDGAEVRRIAHEVAGDETDIVRAACRLRDRVHRNMTLDLGIAVTPASEVIRQRKGTCVAASQAAPLTPTTVPEAQRTDNEGRLLRISGSKPAVRL